MIHFKNFNNFDTYFLNSFQNLKGTEEIKEKLRNRIEDLYMNDNHIQYDTKGQTFCIWNNFEGSMLEIVFN